MKEIKFSKLSPLVFLLIVCVHCEKTEDDLSAYALLPALGDSISETFAPATICPVALPPAGVSIADTVLEAPGHSGSGYGDSRKAVNGVCGGGNSAGSMDVFSLAATGEAASITLEWRNKRVYNGAGNDFIVFENPFEYGSAGDVFIEALIVEVSADRQAWCSFAPDYLFTPETDYSPQMSNWSNFAGIRPVLYNQDKNSLAADALFDPTLSGGDHFDLDNLSATDPFGTGCTVSVRDGLQSQGFLYLRLTAATDRFNPDSPGNRFPGSGNTFDTGPDIDGVLSRYVSDL